MMAPDTLETLLVEDLDDLDPGETIGTGPPVSETVDVRGASSLESAVVLGALLGRGGMAEVRDAEQRALGRRVAVKSSHAKDRSVGGRLVQEAQITGALEHPSIVPVHDILLDADGRPHIVLQRVHGDSWEALIDDAVGVFERFGTRDLLGWNIGVLEAVCNAVHFAHEQGIVHRDLKPDNVMVGGFGQVYVLDWGIAVSVREDETRFPKASEQRRIAGTPRYMAPEMVTGDGRIGRPTDVYLLGALLYRILDGRPPHRGFDIRSILANIPLFEPDLPDAPAELVALIRAATLPDPKDRVESAEAFRRGLHAFIEHRGALLQAEQAEQTLEQLEALLSDEDVDRVAVYDLFGACRFGFKGALSAWPENLAAADGLERATMAMVSWELDQGDDRAAEILLGVLDAVPPEVAKKVAELREGRLAQYGVLARLAQDRDPDTGRRVRLGAIGIFTVLWSVSPWIARGGGTATRLVLSGMWLCVMVVILLVGRKDWVRSSVNRRVAKLLSLGLGTQFLILAGAAVGTMEIEHLRAMMHAVNAGFVGAAGAMIDKRFWIPAAVFALVYLTAVPLAPWYTPISSGATLVLGAVAAWVWWPRVARLRTR